MPYKYIKSFKRNEGSITGDVTTANNKPIRQVTIEGTTYTKNLADIMPIDGSLNITQNTHDPINITRTLYAMYGMGNYTYGAAQVVPDAGTVTPTIQTSVVTSGGRNGLNITLTGNTIGTYSGKINIPVTSTGDAFVDGALAERTMTATLEVDYDLTYTKGSATVFYMNPSLWDRIEENLGDFDLHNVYIETASAAMFVDAWTSNVDGNMDIIAGNPWEPSAIVSAWETGGTTDACIFYASQYTEGDFDAANDSGVFPNQIVVFGAGDEPRTVSFAKDVASRPDAKNKSLVFVAPVDMNDENSTDVSIRACWEELNAFVSETGLQLDNPVNPKSYMTSVDDVVGAQNFIDACITSMDPSTYLIVVPIASCAQAVLETLRSHGFNEEQPSKNSDGTFDSETYFSFYCTDNGYYYPDVVSLVTSQTGGITGMSYATPGIYLDEAVTAYYSGKEMKSVLDEMGVPTDSSGRYGGFTYDHTFWNG